MSSNGPQLRTTWMPSAICLVACLIIGLAIGLAGCREHPRVTSREALDLIKQVYTACNTRNTNRLTQCQQEFDKLKASGALSQSEQRSFEKIIDRARAGDWSYAQSASLQFARDQTR